MSTEPNPNPLDISGNISQLGQDLIVDAYLASKRNGVFVEIGAYDGLLYSNTLFFERERAWAGVCIEPLPDVFQSLKANRTAHCVQAAIGSDDNAQVGFLSIQNDAPKKRMLSGVVNNYNPRHLIRIGHETHESKDSNSFITVTMRTLQSVLSDLKISHVDYLSIDTEGSELAIILSTNLAAIGNPVITIENNYDDPALESALASQGYRLHQKIQYDHLYVHGPAPAPPITP